MDSTAQRRGNGLRGLPHQQQQQQTTVICLQQSRALDDSIACVYLTAMLLPHCCCLLLPCLHACQVWLLVARCCVRASRSSHAPLVWLRPLLCLALLLYVAGVGCSLALYLGDPALFPATYLKSLIWSYMMAAAATSLMLVLEIKQVRWGA